MTKRPFLERLQSEVQDVYFDYDKSDVREDARATLQRNADALKALFKDFPTAIIVVEGHCDERGSAEYNLGLGDRRATSAKEFLVQLGVPADRLKTISYGKERPQCTEANEELLAEEPPRPLRGPVTQFNGSAAAQARGLSARETDMTLRRVFSFRLALCARARRPSRRRKKSSKSNATSALLRDDLLQLKQSVERETGQSCSRGSGHARSGQRHQPVRRRAGKDDARPDEGAGRQVLKPVSALTGKVDSMTDEFRFVKESVTDLSVRLGKLEQQIIDLDTAIKIARRLHCNRRRAGPAITRGNAASGAFRRWTCGTMPCATRPPASTISRSQEFNDYLKCFGYHRHGAVGAVSTLATSSTARANLQDAVKAFDAVLERYPDNTRTLDARLMKGRALVKLGQRNEGAKEFREIINLAKGSEQAAKAATELRALGLAVRQPRPPDRPRRRNRARLDFRCARPLGRRPAGSVLPAGEFPRNLKRPPGHDARPRRRAWLPENGTTPARLEGPQGWISQFSPVTDPKDLSFTVYVKHDGAASTSPSTSPTTSCTASTRRAGCPRTTPRRTNLTRDGWPWFGDEIELLINAGPRWKADESAAGNGFSWQMVCNLTKSRMGGVGDGGLLEGEPRSDPGRLGHVPPLDRERRHARRARQAEAGRQGIHHGVGGPVQSVPGD